VSLMLIFGTLWFSLDSSVDEVVGTYKGLQCRSVCSTAVILTIELGSASIKQRPVLRDTAAGR